MQQSTMQYELTFNRTHICNPEETHLLYVSPCRLKLTEYVIFDDFTILRKEARCIGTLPFLEPGKVFRGRYKLRVMHGLTLNIRVLSLGENEATFGVENLDDATWAKLREGARPISDQDDMIDAFRLQVSLLEQRVASLETRLKENLNGYTPT